MKKRNIILIGIFLIMISLIQPTGILYLLEDMNTDALHDTLTDILNDKKSGSNHQIIDVVYAKYGDQSYQIDTSDSREPAVLYYQIDNQTISNKTLMKLQELKEIGLIKASLFTYLQDNQEMITRTKEFHGEQISYIRNSIYLPNDRFETAFLSYEIENVSGKVISLKLPKQYIEINQTVLTDYITYLDLAEYDWEYHESYLLSKQLRAEIKIETIHDIAVISLIPHPFE